MKSNLSMKTKQGGYNLEGVELIIPSKAEK